ncbi:MAG TPA: SGNH/GDSL hydrolase family protein [Terriglobales bacterium]|nr:SGNH/GDSL hydrolase family protein [Terriglobales bacterium]
MKLAFAILLVWAIGNAPAASAQSSAHPASPTAPPASAAQSQAAPRSPFPAMPQPATLEEAQKVIAQQWDRLQDWAQLKRYADANAELGPPRAGEQRVVFMGDSITDFWKLADYFPGKPYVDRGISGQTTPQMLIRMRPDVIDLQPKVVVVLAGTNDIAGNTGPMTLKQIEDSYASMAEVAAAHGIAVVFSSVLPVHDKGTRPQTPRRDPEKIRALNDWLKSYCSAHRLVYLDYYRHMLGPDGMLRTDLAADGLHPNAEGYKIMAPLAEQAIERALAAR